METLLLVHALCGALGPSSDAVCILIHEPSTTYFRSDSLDCSRSPQFEFHAHAGRQEICGRRHSEMVSLVSMMTVGSDLCRFSRQDVPLHPILH
jgi:hypothetical protein